jgi:hypothetical protein
VGNWEHADTVLGILLSNRNSNSQPAASRCHSATDYTGGRYILSLCDKSIADTDTFVQYSGLVATQFTWVVNLGTLSLNGEDTLPIFYLGVNASDSTGDFLYVTAHYINITAEAVTTSSSAPTSSSTSTSARTQSVTGTSTSTNSNTPTSSPSTEDTSTKKSGGLSTGAAVGIAVACTLIVLSLFAGLGYFYYRNRKLRRQLAQATASESGGWMKPELGVSGARGELAAPVAELAPGYHLGHELDGGQTWNR